MMQPFVLDSPIVQLDFKPDYEKSVKVDRLHNSNAKLSVYRSENQIQRVFFNDIRDLRKWNQLRCHVYKNDNEGNRSEGGNWNAVMAGLWSGIADVTAFTPGKTQTPSGFHIAFIEFKGFSVSDAKLKLQPDMMDVRLGCLSKKQKEFRDLCVKEGTPYICTHEPQEAIKFLQANGFIK